MPLVVPRSCSVKDVAGQGVHGDPLHRGEEVHQHHQDGEQLELGDEVDRHRHQQRDDHQRLGAQNPSPAAAETFAVAQIDQRPKQPFPRRRQIERGHEEADLGRADVLRPHSHGDRRGHEGDQHAVDEVEREEGDRPPPGAGQQVGIGVERDFSRGGLKMTRLLKRPILPPDGSFRYGDMRKTHGRSHGPVSLPAARFG